MLFGQERAEVHIALDSLRLPLLKADPATVAFFEPFIDKILRADLVARSLVDQVKQVIGDSLRGDAPTLEVVAAKLNTSGRTLRRRLNAEGQTFQALLDESRFSLAKQHIESGRISIPEISFLLGFSEPSAFHRAFRRWTGTTPQAYAPRAPRRSGCRAELNRSRRAPREDAIHRGEVERRMNETSAISAMPCGM